MTERLEYTTNFGDTAYVVINWLKDTFFYEDLIDDRGWIVYNVATRKALGKLLSANNHSCPITIDGKQLRAIEAEQFRKHTLDINLPVEFVRQCIITIDKLEGNNRSCFDMYRTEECDATFYKPSSNRLLGPLFDDYSFIECVHYFHITKERNAESIVLSEKGMRKLLGDYSVEFCPNEERLEDVAAERDALRKALVECKSIIDAILAK